MPVIKLLTFSNQGEVNWILADQVTGADWKRRDEPDTEFPRRRNTL